MKAWGYRPVVRRETTGGLGRRGRRRGWAEEARIYRAQAICRNLGEDTGRGFLRLTTFSTLDYRVSRISTPECVLGGGWLAG